MDNGKRETRAASWSGVRAKCNGARQIDQIGAVMQCDNGPAAVRLGLYTVAQTARGGYCSVKQRRRTFQRVEDGGFESSGFGSEKGDNIGPGGLAN